MGETYIIRKTYENLYTHRMESIDLRYTVYDGFDCADAAYAFLDAHGIMRGAYVIVQVHNRASNRIQMYPVTEATALKAIVFAREASYVREYEYRMYEALLAPAECDASPLFAIAREFRHPCISPVRRHTARDDLTQAYEISAIAGPPYRELRENACELVAEMFFDTLVPVDALDVMNEYFDRLSDAPAGAELWKNGIAAYNPFRNEAVYAHERKPHTLDEYPAEHG